MTITRERQPIGAVTYVFVNDPTRGYAIFAENMLGAGSASLTISVYTSVTEEVQMGKSKLMKKRNAVFLLIAGVIMGTVFTVGMRYWNAPVTRDDAIHVTAVFSSYEEQKSRGHTQEIIIRFEDGEQLYIDGTCITNELTDKISCLMPGTVVSMIVHPNSNTIMQMSIGAEELLNFEDSARKLTSETSVFMYLGVFFYILSVWGLLGLFIPKR